MPKIKKLNLGSQIYNELSGKRLERKGIPVTVWREKTENEKGIQYQIRRHQEHVSGEKGSEHNVIKTKDKKGIIKIKSIKTKGFLIEEKIIKFNPKTKTIETTIISPTGEKTVKKQKIAKLSNELKEILEYGLK
jgi:high-affinity K+ transport system ATPase subunit B